MNYETQVLGDSTIIMDGDDRRRSRKKLIIGAGIAVALVAAAVAISMRGGGDTAAAPAPGAKRQKGRKGRMSHEATDVCQRKKLGAPDYGAR